MPSDDSRLAGLFDYYIKEIFDARLYHRAKFSAFAYFRHLLRRVEPGQRSAIWRSAGSGFTSFDDTG